MFNAFPKIFTLGQNPISHIFDGPVEITEKVDGSQFAFGWINGELRMRSKGREFQEPDAMFRIAYERVKEREGDLVENYIYYGEYLNKPKHNTLQYERVPEGNIALFAIQTPDKWLNIDEIDYIAYGLELDVVPIVYTGEITCADQIQEMLKRKSFLGGADIEGVVVKNYHQTVLVGGQYLPIACGKYVSEAFKEVHQKTWKGEHTSGGQWAEFKARYKTEARWHKAIQHLQEKGLHTNSPKDIGPLIREVNEDIVAECKQEIMEKLWQIHSREFLSDATKGLPEWYKNKLLESSFNEQV